MLQEILVSTDIIEFVSQHGYDPDDLSDKKKTSIINKQLYNDIVVVDNKNKLLKLFEQKILETGKNFDFCFAWWSNILDKQLTIKKVPLNPIICDNKKLNEDDILEASLAISAKDKIWLKNKFNKQKVILLRKLTNDVRKVSFDDYLKADHKHGIIKNGKKWKLKEGDKIPFNKIFSPIFRNAKHVQIEDPYICHPYYKSGRVTLNRIIKLCDQNCQIIIKTREQYMRKDKDEFNNPSIIENWRTSLMAQTNIKVVYDNTIQIRKIYTDTVEIDWGKGCQAFDGDMVCMSQTELEFKLI